ncbi:MAG: c-type cytochrome [Actinomycetota bacterium]
MRVTRLAAIAVSVGALAFGVAACGDDGEQAATTQPTTAPTTTAPTTTAPTTTAPTTTAPTTTEGTTTAGGDVAAGKTVFASAGCGGCHVLAAAGSTGTVGPSLDATKPTFEKVVTQVTNGGGAMPAFADRLSAEEIQNVAAFVSQSAGG